MPSPYELIASVQARLNETGYHLILEPGRSLVGNSGTLITKVIGVKRNGSQRYLRELLILVANMHITFICSAVILLLLKKLLNINFIESLFTTFWIIEIDNTYHKQHRHHKSLVIPYDHSCWNSFFSTNTLNFY